MEGANWVLTCLISHETIIPPCACARRRHHVINVSSNTNRIPSFNQVLLVYHKLKKLPTNTSQTTLPLLWASVWLRILSETHGVFFRWVPKLMAKDFQYRGVCQQTIGIGRNHYLAAWWHHVRPFNALNMRIIIAPCFTGPLEHCLYPCSQGKPIYICIGLIPTFISKSCRRVARNSRPLSGRMNSGLPCFIKSGCDAFKISCAFLWGSAATQSA